VLFQAKAKKLTLYSEIMAVYCIKNTKRSNNEHTNCTILTVKPDGIYTVCPTRYRTRHFFSNYNTNEDIATKFEQQYVRCVRNEEECVCSPLQISLQYPH